MQRKKKVNTPPRKSINLTDFTDRQEEEVDENKIFDNDFIDDVKPNKHKFYELENNNSKNETNSK